MNAVFTCFLFLGVISCNHHFQNKTIETVSVHSIPDAVIGVDSIKVVYCSGTDGWDYVYKYAKGELTITRTFDGRTINQIPLNHSNKEMIIDRFINYVDMFFITKSERIIVNRVKRDDVICSDYSSLTFESFSGDKLIQKETVKLGEEVYDTEFNPNFWEFFVFLDNLVPTPKGISADDPK